MDEKDKKIVMTPEQMSEGAATLFDACIKPTTAWLDVKVKEDFRIDQLMQVVRQALMGAFLNAATAEIKASWEVMTQARAKRAILHDVETGLRDNLAMWGQNAAALHMVGNSEGAGGKPEDSSIVPQPNGS